MYLINKYKLSVKGAPVKILAHLPPVNKTTVIIREIIFEILYI
jgi:hypothetical protein